MQANMAGVMGSNTGVQAIGGPGHPMMTGQNIGGSPVGGMPGLPMASMNGVNISPPINTPVSQYGVVTCYICGRNGHYARNCWQAASKQKPEEENSEKREMLVASNPQLVIEPKKRSPRSKARILRELRSYIAESDEDSEEVKEETGRLLEELEKKKKGRRVNAAPQATTSRTYKKNFAAKQAMARQKTANEDDFRTPTKMCAAEASSEGMVDYALTQTKTLSALKANEIRKICDREGVRYVVKNQAIEEIVCCRTRLAYEGFFEKERATPSDKATVEGLERIR
ncbi:hypothetical protein CBR_g18633 [Chara braunii]|uniref:CCHC-type domain-containing protein n=1 Tax=Chara braunii TaxID=69332 RepID=A0A388JTA9_CHABU|nr:hypothetical protein CBR_g18633 [Chara braunii]|eukprot:GBG61038.1 hypothetical protein CBR_g18633 [Chara braunii]